VRDRFEDPTWLMTQMRIDQNGVHRCRDSNQVPSAGILCCLSFTSEEMTNHEAARNVDLDRFTAE
jgi:hypothetical protein